MEKLIALQRSIIPACDVASQAKLKEIVIATSAVPGIGAYKVGLRLGLRGLKRAVTIIRRNCDVHYPVIYDHQKGGTDIPDLGVEFAQDLKSFGVDAAILFPFGGAATERKWIKACQDADLVVLVGGHMTQPEFLESEGGFISDSAPERIYTIAVENGVTNFVVPGNKVEFVLKYRQLLEKLLGKGNFTLYAPGFIKQGGNLSETGEVAGEDWHAIVGSALYNQKGVANIRTVALELTSQITRG